MTMFNLFFAGLTLAAHLFLPRHNARLQFLQLQIKMLKARLKSDRVVPTPEEKADLLRLGATMDHDNEEVAILYISRLPP